MTHQARNNAPSTVTTQRPSVLTDGAALVPDNTGAAGEIVAANANRHAVTIANPGANTIWVGPDAGLTVGEGLAIPSGAERYFETQAAIYGITAAAATTNVTWLEESYA